MRRDFEQVKHVAAAATAQVEDTVAHAQAGFLDGKQRFRLRGLDRAMRVHDGIKHVKGLVVPVFGYSAVGGRHPAYCRRPRQTGSRRRHQDGQSSESSPGACPTR